MKYFTKERLSFQDEHANEKWNEMLQDYFSELKKYSKEFSLELRHLLENGEFHDAKILSIALLPYEKKEGQGKYKIVVELSGYHNDDVPYHGYLIHQNVTEYHASLNLKDFPFDDYLYGEVLKDQDGFWIHNFLVFYDYNEIMIKCEDIDWKEK